MLYTWTNTDIYIKITFFKAFCANYFFLHQCIPQNNQYGKWLKIKSFKIKNYFIFANHIIRKYTSLSLGSAFCSTSHHNKYFHGTVSPKTRLRQSSPFEVVPQYPFPTLNKPLQMYSLEHLYNIYASIST